MQMATFHDMTHWIKHVDLVFECLVSIVAHRLLKEEEEEVTDTHFKKAELEVNILMDQANGDMCLVFETLDENHPALMESLNEQLS